MSDSNRSAAPFELRLTPDSTSWPVSWPERIRLSPVFGVFRGETRAYVPECTCEAIVDLRSSSVEERFCSVCWCFLGYYSHDRRQLPSFCPGCGAKVVVGDE